MLTNDHVQGAHCATADELLDFYLNFLKRSQGLADATLVLRRLHVHPFERTGALADLRGLLPSTIHDYVIKTAKPLTRASRKHLVSGLRSFLRIAHINGLLAQDLVEAVPVILTRKLDRLPQTIPWEVVQKLLKVPDQTKADRETRLRYPASGSQLRTADRPSHSPACARRQLAPKTNLLSCREGLQSFIFSPAPGGG